MSQVTGRSRRIAITFAFLFAATCASGAAAGDRTAPNCPLDLARGGPARLEQFRGKVVYVDFWASWCVPCLASFPFMERMNQDLAPRGLVILGVNMDARPEDAQHFLARHPVSFPVALSGNADCARKFGVGGMPSSYLIDRKGVIRSVHVGFRPGEAAALRSLVEHTLAEQGTRS